MAGIRTAPTVDGNPSIVSITARMVDNEGKPTSQQLYVPTATYTTALAEAYVAALQAATQASIYEVGVSNLYVGQEAKVNAESNERSTFADVVNLRYNNATKQGFTTGVNAPVAGLFVLGTDDPDPNSALLSALNSAVGNLAPGYFVVSYRFNQQRAINQAVKP